LEPIACHSRLERVVHALEHVLLHDRVGGRTQQQALRRLILEREVAADAAAGQDAGAIVSVMRLTRPRP
jgi:hypothetical protein